MINCMQDLVLSKSSHQGQGTLEEYFQLIEVCCLSCKSVVENWASADLLLVLELHDALQRLRFATSAPVVEPLSDVNPPQRPCLQ